MTARAVAASEPSEIGRWTNRLVNLLGTFVMSAIAAIAFLVGNFIESFNPARLGVILVVLLALNLLRYPRLFFCREFTLYFTFTGYMLVSLLWTNDVVLATNSLLPTLDCVLILLLVGALVTYHNLRAVLAGMLAGFLVCAAFYDVTHGFPFVRPDAFSYNAIAGMFLFGLFITLMFGWAMRMRILPLALGLVIMVHIAATTSIKTNLGVALGGAAAALMYFKQFMTLIQRNAIALIVVVVLIVHAVASSEVFIETVQGGLDRVSAGVKILIARDDQSGATEFGARKNWGAQGITGWLENPLFGHGVEAFRDDFGVTSHSTPIDLLYNAGVIGLTLFYSIFASLAWRLQQTRHRRHDNLGALLLAVLVCYIFMSLSGTMHYSYHLAVFIAISSALLRPERVRGFRAAASAAVAQI
jgi:hypothetical protein